MLCTCLNTAARWSFIIYCLCFCFAGIQKKFHHYFKWISKLLDGNVKSFQLQNYSIFMFIYDGWVRSQLHIIQHFIIVTRCLEKSGNHLSLYYIRMHIHIKCIQSGVTHVLNPNLISNSVCSDGRKYFKYFTIDSYVYIYI